MDSLMRNCASKLAPSDASRNDENNATLVMPGLVPGIHVFTEPPQEDVDGRDKPGHDEKQHMVGSPSPSHQLIRELPDRLAIDRGPIPLAHGLEIRGALAIGRARLEAVGVQELRGELRHFINFR
jgi:hypothetical protein